LPKLGGVVEKVEPISRKDKKMAKKTALDRLKSKQEIEINIQ
jgi:hypothetical protein